MKQFKFREIGEDENFDLNNFCNNVPFTQANFYGNWQKSLGRSVRRFLIDNNNKTVAYFQLIKYPLLLNKSYLYIPYGPVIKNFKELPKDFFANLKQELKRIAKAENAVFVRLDFTPSVPNDTLAKFFTKAPLYTYHSAYFQPRAEWFLGLGKPKEELLMDMHTDNRYSIRLSEKKQITTEIITKDFEKYFDVFYELMTETAKRNGFSLHSRNYYEHIFTDLSKISGAHLVIAKYGQKILVIKIIIVFGIVSNDVFTGSSSEERNRRPTYLTIWRAISHAKELGCQFYNFGGISTENKIYKGWDGLTAFKKKFGGEEIKHSDFFDLVTSPFWYWVYNFRKRLKKINL